jgi:hypothetical protein
MRIGGKGSSNFATSCSKGRARLVLGVADQAEEDPGVAEVDLVVEEDSGVEEDSAAEDLAAVAEDLAVAAEDLAVAEETGREAGRE